MQTSAGVRSQEAAWRSRLGAFLGSQVQVPRLGGPGAPSLELRQLWLQVQCRSGGGAFATAAWSDLASDLLHDSSLGPHLAAVHDAYLEPLQRLVPLQMFPARAVEAVEAHVLERAGMGGRLPCHAAVAEAVARARAALVGWASANGGGGGGRADGQPPAAAAGGSYGGLLPAAASGRLQAEAASPAGIYDAPQVDCASDPPRADPHADSISRSAARFARAAAADPAAAAALLQRTGAHAALNVQQVALCIEDAEAAALERVAALKAAGASRDRVEGARWVVVETVDAAGEIETGEGSGGGVGRRGRGRPRKQPVPAEQHTSSGASQQEGAEPPGKRQRVEGGAGVPPAAAAAVAAAAAAVSTEPRGLLDALPPAKVAALRWLILSLRQLRGGPPGAHKLQRLARLQALAAPRGAAAARHLRAAARSSPAAKPPPAAPHAAAAPESPIYVGWTDNSEKGGDDEGEPEESDEEECGESGGEGGGDGGDGRETPVWNKRPGSTRHMFKVAKTPKCGACKQ